jgi:hypothetical protein
MSIHTPAGHAPGNASPPAHPATPRQVQARADSSAAELLQALGLPAVEAVVVLGGGNTSVAAGLQPRLAQLVVGSAIDRLAAV